MNAKRRILPSIIPFTAPFALHATKETYNKDPTLSIHNTALPRVLPVIMKNIRA